jgi:hypothetical protein
VLEYHALLMKVAGVDGAIADWYGNEEFNDYAIIHRNTASLFDALGKHGLKFAVCYEDRAINAMAGKRAMTPEQAVEHGRTHLQFCEGNWFGRPGYATWDGKPLLLVFGPDYLSPAQWDDVFEGLRAAPAFFTLHERKGPAVGSFAWPPMWRSKGGVLDPKDLDDYFDQFSKRPGAKIAGAWPGFHDFYQEAGLHPSYGRLDARDGETFRGTLGRALASGSPYIQIASWNDFGEGTSIEPTRGYGYRYLEMVQDARRRAEGDRFSYRPADLRLPLRIYALRKRGADPKAVDEAVKTLSGGDGAGAARRLDAIAPRSGAAGQ